MVTGVIIIHVYNGTDAIPLVRTGAHITTHRTVHVVVQMHLPIFLSDHVHGRGDHHRNPGEVDDDDPPLLRHDPSQSSRMMFPCHNMEDHDNFDNVKCTTVRMSAFKVVGDDDHDFPGHSELKTAGTVLPCHYGNNKQHGSGFTIVMMNAFN